MYLVVIIIYSCSIQLSNYYNVISDNYLQLKRTFLLLVTAALTLSSCKVGRFIYWNFADINDNKKFPSRAVNKDAATLFHFDSTGEKKHPTKMTEDGKELSFDRSSKNIKPLHS